MNKRVLRTGSPVKPLPLRRLVLVVWVHDDLFASEVDYLIEVQPRYVHLAGEEDGAVACEGQSEQSCHSDITHVGNQQLLTSCS